MKYVKENYERFYGDTPAGSSYGKPVKVVEQLAELLPAGASALDLGAGDGRHALLLASKGARVKAVDISEAALDKLRRMAEQAGLRVDTQVVDLESWPIDGDYDAMIAVVIFQHLHKVAAANLLANMKDRTRPGGLNAVTVFTRTGDRYEMDRTEDPDSFYPEDGWLQDYYHDWEVLAFESASAPLIGKFDQYGQQMRNVVEKILVCKPLTTRASP